MLIVVPAVAAAAIVLTVAGNCGRNMLQTYRVVRNANDNAGTFTVLFPQQQQSSSSSLVQTVTQQRGMTPTDEARDDDDARDVLTQLQAMTRQQLLEVFVQGSTSPASFEDIYGEWNGCLLDNNGKIMTTVSNLMTHSLFASSLFSKMMQKLGTLWQQIKKQRKKGTASSSIPSSSSATRTSTNYKTRWNGKAFFPPSSSTTSKEGNNAGTTVTTERTLGRGSNRFERTLRNNMDTTTTTTANSSSSSSGKQHNKDKAAPVVFTKHDFEYCLRESALGLTTGNTNSNTSLCLKYTNHQAPLSLWYTMQDELRIVTLPKTVLASTLSNEAQQQQQQVLLGIGYMAWSGGIWNASPFVLWRA